MREHDITLDWIKSRCVEEGECWIWQGPSSSIGYPTVHPSRSGSQLLVRRLVVALDGRPAQPRQPVTAICGDKLCCCPAHLRPTTFKKVAQAAAKRGAYSTLGRSVKIALGKRRGDNVRLSLEIAREIRASPESGPVLAARYGVNRTRIAKIRRGEAWKEYGGNPFSGLGAR